MAPVWATAAVLPNEPVLPELAEGPLARLENR